jgi:hypothetical protein
MKKLIGILATLLCSCAVMYSADNSQHPPVIVAQRAFRGQRAAILPTTLFTPATDGMYLVSVYVSASNTADGKAFPNVFLSWTDDVNSWQSQQIGVSTGSSLNVTWGSGQFVVVELAHQPIQVSTNASNNSSDDAANSATYNLYVVVEQL